jgi:hypothetical protein
MYKVWVSSWNLQWSLLPDKNNNETVKLLAQFNIPPVLWNSDAICDDGYV